MIEIANLVNNTSRQLGIWVGATTDGTELARVADRLIADNIGMISVVPDAVRVVWPWLEERNIKIFPRFYFGMSKTPTDADMSQLAVDINAAFKQGASGAVIFVSQRNLSVLAESLSVVRDDLFFNKDLIIGLDISDIDSNQWSDVFDNVMRIRANGLMLALTRDTGDKSDFVGRVYAALTNWNPEFSGDVYWMTGTNPLRAEQVMRLTDAVRPELSERTHLMMCN